MASAAAALIPAVVGLALWSVLPALQRRLPGEALAGAAARAVLAAAVLSILLFVQVLRRETEAPRLPWIHVGRTTKIDWVTLLDPLALLLGGAALLVLLLAPIAGVAAGAGARAYARVGLAAGGALVLATAGSLWQAGIGVALAAMACGPGPGEHEREDMPVGAWPLGLVVAGLTAAGIAWYAGAGDLDGALLGRTALAQGASELLRGRVGGPFGGLAPAVVGGAGAAVAALAWTLAWPRLWARAWGDGAAAVAAASVAVGPAVAVFLSRAYLPLALAPTALALLSLGAGGLAARAGWRAARAGDVREAAAASGQVGLAIAAATIGLGGFAAASRLAAAAGLAIAGLVLARASGLRRVGLVAAASSAIAVALAGGEAIAALASDLSAWSPAINVVAPLLALAALAGAAAGWSRVFADRTEGTGWEAPASASMLGGTGLALALAAAVVGGGALSGGLAQVFLGGRLLIGAFALGPRPDGMSLGTWPVTLVVAVALAGGALLAGRLQTAPARAPRRAGGAAGRVLRVAEAGLRWLVLRPGDERVAEAPRGGELQRSLLVAVAGLLAILGSVFCNPDVVVLGPTRVHPVDLGGLDAAIHGSRRAAGAGAQEAPPEQSEEESVPVYAPDAEGPSRESLLQRDGAGPRGAAAPNGDGPAGMSAGAGGRPDADGPAAGTSAAPRGGADRAGGADERLEGPGSRSEGAGSKGQGAAGRVEGAGSRGQGAAGEPAGGGP